MSWGEFDALCLDLAATIKVRLPQLDLIIAIARGGLVPAVKLSHYLRCRDIAVIEARRTRSDRIGDLPPDGLWMVASGLPDRPVSQVAIVEDVIGHGHTLSAVDSHVAACWPSARRFSVALVEDMNLEKTPAFTERCQYFAARALRDAPWVVFPWEHPAAVVE